MEKVYYGSELYQYALKHADKNHKYIRKEMINGKMRYYYDPDVKKGSLKTAARDLEKSASVVSNVSKLRNPATDKAKLTNKDDVSKNTSSAPKKANLNRLPKQNNQLEKDPGEAAKKANLNRLPKQNIQLIKDPGEAANSTKKEPKFESLATTTPQTVVYPGKTTTHTPIDYKEYDKQYQEAESKKLLESNSRPWITDLNEVDRGDEDSVRGYINAINRSLKPGYKGNEVYTSGVVELWNDEQSRDAVFKEYMSKIETVAKKATSAKENVTDNIDRMLRELEDIMTPDVKHGELSIEDGERLIELKIYVKNMTLAYDETFWRYNKYGDFNIEERDRVLMNTYLTNAVYGFLDYMTYCEQLNKRHKGKSIFEKLFK